MLLPSFIVINVFSRPSSRAIVSALWCLLVLFHLVRIFAIILSRCNCCMESINWTELNWIICVSLHQLTTLCFYTTVLSGCYLRSGPTHRDLGGDLRRDVGGDHDGEILGRGIACRHCYNYIPRNMADDALVVAAILQYFVMLVACGIQIIRKKRPRKYWVKPWLTLRTVHGAYHSFSDLLNTDSI